MTLVASSSILTFMKFNRQMLKKILSPRELVLFYKRWSEEEVCYLEENYGVLTVKEIADYLHRSKGDIRYMTRVLQLDKLQPLWTKEDIEYLLSNKDRDISVLAEELGRTEQATRRKLERLCQIKDSSRV